MKLQTPVEVGRCPFELGLQDGIVVLGSCFADGIGEKLLHHGFKACVNPFGTLYNPESVVSSMERLSSGLPFTEADCVRMGAGSEMICSFSHHTKAARRSPGEFLESANKALAEACEAWTSASCVIVTLGTSWCYVNKADGKVVSNCLKRPASEFERVFLESEKTAALLESICARFPEKRFIFTVSPVRHMADGAAGNARSKASLLLAESRVCSAHPDRCAYFPSFEIMMDELRDYRFYAEDMVHPSAQAVDYIWERFCDFAVCEGDKKAMEEAFRNYRRSLHRDILSK